MDWADWNVEAKPASGPMQDPKPEVEQSLDQSRDQKKDKTETVWGQSHQPRNTEPGFDIVSKSFGFGLNYINFFPLPSTSCKTLSKLLNCLILIPVPHYPSYNGDNNAFIT